MFNTLEKLKTVYVEEYHGDQFYLGEKYIFETMLLNKTVIKRR